MATLREQEKIKRDYLEAIRALKSQDIEATLWQMYNKNPVALRRLLKMIFKPISISIEVEGYSTKAKSRITAYELTKEFEAFAQDIICDHRGIICPLTGLEIKGTTPDHIINWLKCAGPFKFQSRANCIACGKAKERTTIAFEQGGHKVVSFLFEFIDNKGMSTKLVQSYHRCLVKPNKI